MMMVVGLGVLVHGGAYASVNMPLHHWAYEAIERLTALGVIDRAMVVTKPYSRKVAATYVARAIQLIRDDRVSLDGREVLAEPLLDRLVTELHPELVDLGVLPGDPEAKAGALRYGGRLQVEAGKFRVGEGAVRFRENRGGEYYADGLQVQADLRGWVEITDAVALSAAPKFIGNRRALGSGATANGDNLYMQELNAKFTGGNVAFQVGRSSLWWGPGYHGTLLMSDHHFPLDMLQLGSEEPFRLPWVFRPFGYWKIQSFLARLESSRDFPRAQVFGLRAGYLPADWLEMGLTRLTQFGGRGHDGKDQYFPAIIVNSYFNDTGEYSGQTVKTGAFETNEQFMIDFLWRIPPVPYLIPFPAGMQMYLEFGVEDPPSGDGIVFGMYVPQVLRGSTMDLRIEYADTDLRRRFQPSVGSAQWYNHAIWTSGMRTRGFPFGHHMGTDATDLFLRATGYLSDELQLGANLNLQERDRGRPVHEKKREVAFDLTQWLSNQAQITVGYTYQRVSNPGQVTGITPFVETFTGGLTSINHFLWMSLAVQF
jgi:hypothetical protein